MLQPPTTAVLETSDVIATVAQCEEILSTIASLATAEAYQDLYDDLVRRSERPLPPAERTQLERAIDEVRWAWWRAKCSANNGAGTLRALTVHSSQLHTGT